MRISLDLFKSNKILSLYLFFVFPFSQSFGLYKPTNEGIYPLDFSLETRGVYQEKFCADKDDLGRKIIALEVYPILPYLGILLIISIASFILNRLYLAHEPIQSEALKPPEEIYSGGESLLAEKAPSYVMKPVIDEQSGNEKPSGTPHPHIDIPYPAKVPESDKKTDPVPPSDLLEPVLEPTSDPAGRKSDDFIKLDPDIYGALCDPRAVRILQDPSENPM